MEHNARLHRLLREAGASREDRQARAGGPAPALRTISAASHAILAYYGIDPMLPGDAPAAPLPAEIEILDVQSLGGHLTMTIAAPMPWNGRCMTIVTGDPATIRLPGMALSSVIAQAAIGRPVDRLVPHPAFEGRADLVVTGIERAEDAGTNSLVLHFRDGTERLPRRPKARGPSLH